MAFGAGKRDVLGMVAAQGMKLVLIGIGCGVVLSLVVVVSLVAAVAA